MTAQKPMPSLVMKLSLVMSLNLIPADSEVALTVGSAPRQVARTQPTEAARWRLPTA